MTEHKAKSLPRRFSLRFLLGFVVTVAVVIACSQYAYWRMNTIPIANAVAEFNSRSQRNTVGSQEPPITTEEVFHAIEKQLPTLNVDNETKRLLDVALRTSRLPMHAWLRARNSMTFGQPPKSYPIWWVDLHLDGGPASTSVVPVRATDRPSVATEDPPWRNRKRSYISKQP